MFLFFFFSAITSLALSIVHNKSVYVYLSFFIVTIDTYNLGKCIVILMVNLIKRKIHFYNLKHELLNSKV